MAQLILAAECDVANEVICVPENVNELFEFPTIFTIGEFEVTRTVILMFLAAFVVVALLYFGLRRQSLVPTKFGATIEGLIGFVRDGVGRDVIGPESTRYLPYLLSMFLFVLVGNLFEVTPLINFPITSRMAIPALLSLVTYWIFVILGFSRNHFKYLFETAWPKTVPVGLRPLVGLIELVSVFFLRPLTLAVRLFANMMAGHLMLSLLLGSAVVFLMAIPEEGARGLIGIPWLAFGLFIFVFEIVVSVLQAYIITLLTAVYIDSSIHFEH